MCNSGPMARPPKPLDNTKKAALFTAAAAVFAQDGYHRTSLNQIIAAAKWGKSSFYHYFPDKLALHNAIVKDLKNQLTAQLHLPEITALDANTYWPALEKLLASLATAHHQQPQTTYLGQMFHHAAADEPEGQLRQLRRDLHHWLEQIVHQGLAVGALRTDLPELLIIRLAVATLTALDQWVLNERHQTPSETTPLTAEHVSDLLRRQLGAT